MKDYFQDNIEDSDMRNDDASADWQKMDKGQVFSMSNDDDSLEIDDNNKNDGEA